MKNGKIFLISMYVHLILSILTPISILGFSNSKATGIILVFYVLMICAVLIIGWVSVGTAVMAIKRGEYEKVKSGWKLLKYGAIPFYIINFTYSLIAWLVLVGASRGIFIVLVPIPILITGTMIVQSGCFGWCCIHYLNKQNSGYISKIHYVLQIVSVLDIISTFQVLKKAKTLR